MKVGLLLSKEIKDIPSFKTNYKVERNVLKETNKEIEQELFLKNCQKFFKEVNNKKHDKVFLSVDKDTIHNKTKTTNNLPVIIAPNLNLENTTTNKTTKSKFCPNPKDKSPSSDRNNINTTHEKTEKKTKFIHRAKTAEKNKKIKNKINQNIDRRYDLLTKKINKIKKPLFHNQFEYDEKTNKCNNCMNDN
jgi:hypothetical protein